LIKNNKTKAEDNCNKIVDELRNPTKPSINATIAIDDCDQAVIQFQGELNYEALKFVSKTMIIRRIKCSYIAFVIKTYYFICRYAVILTPMM